LSAEITACELLEEKMELPQNLRLLSASLEADFKKIADATGGIRQKLQEHANGKLLKGDEIIGWLGEIYGKLLLNGTLVPDNYDYEVKAQDMCVSVKARKGEAGGWQITSIIPRIDGEGCPTHLVFIQFTNTYSIKRVWLFPWKDLRHQKRFKEKRVRGEHRGYYVRIKPSRDKAYLIYPDC
jgi:hypothetical protein